MERMFERALLAAYEFYNGEYAYMAWGVALRRVRTRFNAPSWQPLNIKEKSK